MTAYLQFKSGNGVVLLEVDEVYPSSGEQEAGLGQRARDHVADAMIATRSGFEDAVRHAIHFSPKFPRVIRGHGCSPGLLVWWGVGF